MKIPLKVKIGGHTLLVNSTDKKTSRDLGLDGFCGKTYLGGDVIMINRHSVCRSQQEESFLHEVIHHILFRMGKNDICLDEELVQGLASWLYAFLKENGIVK